MEVTLSLKKYEVTHGFVLLCEYVVNHLQTLGHMVDSARHRQDASSSTLEIDPNDPCGLHV